MGFSKNISIKIIYRGVLRDRGGTVDLSARPEFLPHRPVVLPLVNVSV